MPILSSIRGRRWICLINAAVRGFKLCRMHIYMEPKCSISRRWMNVAGLKKGIVRGTIRRRRRRHHWIVQKRKLRNKGHEPDRRQGTGQVATYINLWRDLFGGVCWLSSEGRNEGENVQIHILKIRLNSWNNLKLSCGLAHIMESRLWM